MSGNSSGGGRFQELLSSTPPATLIIIGVNMFVYALQVLLELDEHRFTMCPWLVLHQHEYYRLITSSLFHGNMFHIGMNMFSAFHLSTMLEKRLGTVPHFVSTLWAMLWTSTLYLAIAWLASALFSYKKWMMQQSLGFSGVLFHLCVLECNMTSHASRSIFGFVSVPAYLYPWALLVVLQMLVPNLSFWGHLAGILTGTLQYYRLLPFVTAGTGIESWSIASPLVRWPSFVPAESTLDGSRQHQHYQDPAALRRAIWALLTSACRMVGYASEAVSVCIFGRGNQLNANIRLPTWASSSSSPMSGGRALGSTLTAEEGPLEEDGEWIGLPTIASLEKEPLTSEVV